jgi:hypothetical protein
MRAKRRERSETPRSERRSASDAFIQYTTGCVLTATRVSIARAGRSSARQWRGGDHWHLRVQRGRVGRTVVCERVSS